jgi:hypothetical protein
LKPEFTDGSLERKPFSGLKKIRAQDIERENRTTMNDGRIFLWSARLYWGMLDVVVDRQGVLEKTSGHNNERNER